MYTYFMGRAGLTARQREYGVRLGHALAAARNQQRLSGGDLAKVSGISLDAIRSVEAGRVASPGFGLVAALSESLGLSLDTLAEQAAGQKRRR